MRKPIVRLAFALGGLAVSLAGQTLAQWGPAVDPCCNPCPVQCAPAQCLVPVTQTCYQRVPVTEYREVKQTVQRPVYETEWRDQEITEYRPITETRTASVPTVTYENVTETQTVCRDMGCWQVWNECTPKIAPCAYDPRPTLSGWWNRTSYAVRSAFTPDVVTRRQWMPNVVTAEIPVTRRVARQGVREVAYNVTKMVPTTTTRKVAVNKVRYVAEEISRTVPVTVFREVPTGTAVAWALAPVGSSSATATALQPKPDAGATARGTTIGPRSADARTDKFRREPNAGPTPVEPFQRDAKQPEALRRDPVKPSAPFAPSSYEEAAPEPAAPAAYPGIPEARHSRDGFRPTSKFRASTAPSMVRVVRPSAAAENVASGPQLPGPAVAAADATR